MQMNQNNFGQAQMQGRPLTVMLVPDLNNIDSFLINPGASMIFLDEGMTGLKLRSRDQNGFLGQDRKWTLKEVTPPPVQQGQYATREEVDAMNTKMDKILDVLSELMK